MKLEMALDPQVSWAEMRKFQWANIRLLAIGIFLSVLISFSFSRRRWGRFHALISSMNEKMVSSDGKLMFADELSYLKIMIEQSGQENEQVEQCVKSYQHDMLRQTAMMIFRGIIAKPEAVHQLLDIYGLEPSEDFYYLCGVALKEADIGLSDLEPLFENCLYCEVTVQDRRTILLLEETALDDRDGDFRLEKARKLMEKLAEHGVEVERMVLSQIYDNISMVNYAYLEIIGLLNNPLTPDKVVLWDSPQRISAKRLSSAQSQALEQYMEALNDRDLQAAESALGQMLAENDSEAGEAHRENELYMCYCIRQALILAVRNDDSEQYAELRAGMVLLDPDSDNFFFEKVCEIQKRYCVDNSLADCLEQAIQYVKENYNRYDLSLEEVADQVGRSRVQMSQLFKSRLGISYIDFLTKLRLDKAQELLAETDKPVKDILVEVGYLDKANFTRKFKANIGMTPGEFRRQKRGEA